MTDHKTGQVVPLMIGGAPMYRRLVEAVPRLSRAILRAFVDGIPIYGQMPREQLEGDILGITERNLLTVVRLLRDRSALTAGELDELEASAARRAEEGVPLEAVHSAYHRGTAIAWETLMAQAGPDDLADVLAGTRIVLDYLSTVTAAVCSAYLLERQSMLSQEQYARQAVISALLSGAAPDQPAGRAGIRLPVRYLVLALAVDRHADEAEPGPGAPIASRRKLRRLRAALDDLAAGPVLSVLDPAGGLALIPVDDGQWDWGSGKALLDSLRSAAGVEVTAAAELAAPREVAAAADRAREVLDVVRWFARPPGLYRLRDVVLEYQLTRPGQGRAELAALLDALDGHPDLVDTLRVHLESRLDRRRTAAELHIHPNTVDYRLRRVRALTGLDPADPAGLHHIAAALAARRAGTGAGSGAHVGDNDPRSEWLR